MIPFLGHERKGTAHVEKREGPVTHERKGTAAPSLRSQSPPFVEPLGPRFHRLEPPHLEGCHPSHLHVAATHCLASPRSWATPPPYTTWPASGDDASSYSAGPAVGSTALYNRPSVKPPPSPPRRTSGTPPTTSCLSLGRMTSTAWMPPLPLHST